MEQSTLTIQSLTMQSTMQAPFAAATAAAATFLFPIARC